MKSAWIYAEYVARREKAMRQKAFWRGYAVGAAFAILVETIIHSWV